MKYFLDTEFHEGFHKPLFGRKRHFIDFISIGIVAEDNREYYAISKDFDIKAAWDSYQIEQVYGGMRNMFPNGKKVYWLRDNVLELIFDEQIQVWAKEKKSKIGFHTTSGYDFPIPFNFKNFKKIIERYGKTNEQIATDIMLFVWADVWQKWIGSSDEFFERGKRFGWSKEPNEFYAYYADYDWVAFCSLFGKMIDLPEGFPMYCKDLKQGLDEKVEQLKWMYGRDIWSNSLRSVRTIGKGQTQEKDRPATFDEKLKALKELKEYPKQTNEHNALADAKWNKELHKFLNSL